MHRGQCIRFTRLTDRPDHLVCRSRQPCLGFQRFPLSAEQSSCNLQASVELGELARGFRELIRRKRRKRRKRRSRQTWLGTSEPGFPRQAPRGDGGNLAQTISFAHPGNYCSPNSADAIGGSAKSRNRSFCVLRKSKTGNFSVVTLRVATLKIPGLVFFVIHQKFSTGTFGTAA